MRKKLFKIAYSLILLAFLSLSHALLAYEIKGHQKYSDWKEAREAASQLKFTVVSTKIGLFSSDVDGYVKEFNYSAQYLPQESVVKEMKISFLVKDLDTDHQSRDEKLHQLCLSVNEYPQIEVNLPGPLQLNGLNQVELEGDAYLRGKHKKIKVKMMVKKMSDSGQSGEKKEHLEITGSSVWDLFEMEIPDPSIAVAKLSPAININFKIIHK